jgi:hypothetical protein
MGRASRRSGGAARPDHHPAHAMSVASMPITAPMEVGNAELPSVGISVTTTVPSARPLGRQTHFLTGRQRRGWLGIETRGAEGERADRSATVPCPRRLSSAPGPRSARTACCRVLSTPNPRRMSGRRSPTGYRAGLRHLPRPLSRDRPAARLGAGQRLGDATRRTRRASVHRDRVAPPVEGTEGRVPAGDPERFAGRLRTPLDGFSIRVAIGLRGAGRAQVMRHVREFLDTGLLAGS